VEFSVAPEDRIRLLAAARAAVADALAGHEPRTVAPVGIFARQAGVFVSFHLDGALRGCIGHPDGNQMLAIVVPQCAVAAATGDPRFDPVSASELDRCVIEVSVLGPISVVRDVGDIVVGRHGLIAEQGWRRGLLLPQVAVEYGWDREAFLARTCGKAGLSADAWKRGATISCFEADVFDDARAAWRRA
jgi:AmmeMemoRadiSam system protein A